VSGVRVPPPLPISTAFSEHHPSQETENMRLFFAIFLPFIGFFLIGRPFAGIICFLLQITILGWIPAAFWAVYAVSEYETDEKIKALNNHKNDA